MKYEDCINLKYEPAKDDLISQFFIEPQGISLKKVAVTMVMRQSLEATIKQIPLKEYAKAHLELKAALDKWC